ncbi:hypothetical protein H257_03209 [Aphanomyces astaci]|uniref:Uncharacterized protein n=1 Tax=Aphanomyces astaci TaxID=112090 RepID=W4H0N9_APHAT|nr:hypothetical protein H257_03209 [Aphanomyces astaci]ETV85477.1 hypothetical protein H257_03209 [Aphanomyces astaci]|eukprot:XP_009825495.1 hypothetical protein H257_03209 [Aphanomyces astaci]
MNLVTFDAVIDNTLQAWIVAENILVDGGQCLVESVACESHVTVDLTYIWISISVVAMIVMALVYVARRVEGANYLHRQRNESTADTVIALATPKSPDW